MQRNILIYLPTFTNAGHDSMSIWVKSLISDFKHDSNIFYTECIEKNKARNKKPSNKRVYERLGDRKSQIAINSRLNKYRLYHLFFSCIHIIWLRFSQGLANLVIIYPSLEFILPLPFSSRVIIHDLIQLKYPRSKVSKFLVLSNLFLCKIFSYNWKFYTCSESVRRKLLVFGIKSQIIMNPNLAPSSSASFPSNLISNSNFLNKPSAYILWIGTTESHKNISALDNLLQKLDSNITVTLVIPSRSIPAARRMLKNCLARITFLSSISNQHLSALYENALCVLCTSKDEGFYRPAYEADYYSTPVFVPSIAVFNRTHFIKYKTLSHLADMINCLERQSDSSSVPSASRLRPASHSPTSLRLLYDA